MDREKVIKGLNDIGGFVAGRIGFEQARNFIRTIDDALELLNELSDRINKLEDANAYLENALLDDQTEIVRCKDCKWWDKKDDSKYGYCHACKHGHHSEHWEIGIYRVYKDDWFCADGERR